MVAGAPQRSGELAYFRALVGERQREDFLEAGEVDPTKRFECRPAHDGAFVLGRHLDRLNPLLDPYLTQDPDGVRAEHGNCIASAGFDPRDDLRVMPPP